MVIKEILLCGQKNYSGWFTEYSEDNKDENWLLNEMMAEKAGIDLTPCKAEGRGHFFKRKETNSARKESGKKRNVIPGGMSDQEVQRRTNFLNEIHFLSFVVIVCNGEFELITETNSYMTWYEEWFSLWNIFG